MLFAIAFVDIAEEGSVAQRLRRFVEECEYASVDIALFLLKRLPSEPWKLTLDRTEWKFGRTSLNIFVFGVILGEISVPILWHILPKAGCSNSIERCLLFDCFFALAPASSIRYLLADREFIGED